MHAGHIFISYSRSDKEVAQKVHRRLLDAGFLVWMDDSIRKGANYGAEIDVAIKQARALVLLFSPSANASVHVHNEIALAVDRKIPIIPVRLSGVEYHSALNYHLVARQYVDAIDDPERAIAALPDTLIESGLAPNGVERSSSVVTSSPPPRVAATPPAAQTRQDQLADAIARHFPDVDVKKRNEDHYLDLHLPSVHPLRGTHLYFNTAKPNIRFGFYVRDLDFVSRVHAAAPDLTVMGHGLRPAGEPAYATVGEAVEAAVAFVRRLQSCASTPRSDTRQEQLARIIVAHFPDAVVKTINTMPYVSIHLPSVHPQYMTHLGFNTGSAKIYFDFYVRDGEYISRVVSATPSVEGRAFGLRLVGNPRYGTVDEAASAALEFLKLLLPHRPGGQA